MGEGQEIEVQDEKEARERARKYLDALEEYPDFKLPNDEIDGLIPSAKVSSWSELVGILQGDTFKKTKNDMIFRGQRGHDWQLASTLGRRFKGGAIPSGKADALLEQFQLAMRGRGYDLAPLQEDGDVWAVGQHYGLNTPLLDWTRSPFVALFFAFSRFEDAETTDFNPSRALYCFNMTKIKEDLGVAADALFFEPRDHRNSRLVNQSGLFTFAPDGDDNIASYIIGKLDELDLLAVNEAGTVTSYPTEPEEAADEAEEGAESKFLVSDAQRAKDLAEYMFKLHIPNTVLDRKACLEALRQMNIHNGNLFPDPGGASQFCNDWLDRLLADEKDEEAQEQKAVEAKQLSDAISKASGPDMLGNIEGLLIAFQDASSVAFEDVAEAASEIKTAADAAMTIDWQYSDSKMGRVRLAIGRALKNMSLPDYGTVEAKSLIAALVDTLAEDAKQSND